jgi:hypothetical protein
MSVMSPLGAAKSVARLWGAMRSLRDARYAGAAGRNIAGSPLIAWVDLMGSKVRRFTLAPLPLLNEPLPLLSHFAEKRFEAKIGC